MKITAAYHKQGSRKFFFRRKEVEMLLYCREKHLLAPLYLFVCRFVGVADISWISLTALFGVFRENLLGKRSFVKIRPKLSRCLLEDLSMLHCIRLHYIAIKALPSKEAESDCLCSGRGINITRTRHNVMYYVPFRLVLNWPAVELVTFVNCTYQHRRSRAWSIFLSPGGVTLDWMPDRRICTIWFVHIITESILPTLRSLSVQHKYLWWLCQSDVYHSKLLIGTDCLQLTFTEKHICHLRFCESTEQGHEQK